MFLTYKRKNNLIFFSQVFLVLVSIIFYFNYANLITYNNIAIVISYLLIIAILIISLIINGINLITFMLICSELILIPLSIQYYSGESYGLLGLNLYPIYLPEIITSIYLYSTTIVFLSALFKFSIKEKVLVKNGGLKLNLSAITVNNIIAITFAIIAFPRLGAAVDGSDRFNMLLPGHAWNQLSIVALLFNLHYLKSNLSVKVTYLFVISWFLVDGERADITGLVLGMLILYFLQKKKKAKKINTIFMCMVGIAFVFLLNSIVVIRNNESLTINHIVGNIFTTATLSDVGYLSNISVDYWHKYGTVGGSLLTANIVSAIPFISPVDFTKFINSAHYPNPGGESIFSEPLLDFGFIGLSLVGMLDFFIYRLIIQFNNNFFYYEYLTVLCSIPRIVWYGRSYFYSSVLFFVPLVFILDVFINRHIKLNSNK